MHAADVVELYATLERIGIRIWVDGGWGVDALLGEQTRPHEDLDIVVEQHDVPSLRALVEARGYADVPRDDTSAWNFVLGDPQGRMVDVHVIVFDSAGNGTYGPAEKGIMYPAASLTGIGRIDSVSVRCISPEFVVKFHSGYPLRATATTKTCPRSVTISESSTRRNTPTSRTQLIVRITACESAGAFSACRARAGTMCQRRSPIAPGG